MPIHGYTQPVDLRETLDHSLRLPQTKVMALDSNTPDRLALAPSVGARRHKPRVWSLSVFVTVVTIALSGATYGLENSLMSPLAAMPEFVKKYQASITTPVTTLSPQAISR